MPTTLSCTAASYSWMRIVPTKERYERDKEYYRQWNNSDKQKQADARKFQKRIEEGRCHKCGRHFERYLGDHQNRCIRCLEMRQIENNLARGGF